MLGTQNAFKCDCATAAENKTRTYRASKREVACFFNLPMTMIWRFGRFPGTRVHAGTGSRISKSRERPPWPGEALEDWARIA